MFRVVAIAVSGDNGRGCPYYWGASMWRDHAIDADKFTLAQAERILRARLKNMREGYLVGIMSETGA